MSYNFLFEFNSNFEIFENMNNLLITLLLFIITIQSGRTASSYMERFTECSNKQGDCSTKMSRKCDSDGNTYVSEC
ncbi:hypothetical protein SNEBB_007429 [Seison nebaliae]|nr:hypothetical protein SNEBB_007429 [Seison nebaliae]